MVLVGEVGSERCVCVYMFLKVRSVKKVENAGYVFILPTASSSYGCKMAATSSSVQVSILSFLEEDFFFPVMSLSVIKAFPEDFIVDATSFSSVESALHKFTSKQSVSRKGGPQ